MGVYVPKRITPDIIALRRMVYRVYADMGEGLPVTPALAKQVLERLPVKGVYRSEQIERLLGNPDKYSPYIDSIAIERALQWDWPVIDRLTMLERQFFYDELAQHRDPFGEVEAGVGNDWATGAGHSAISQSQRYEAWRRGTKDQRKEAGARYRAAVARQGVQDGGTPWGEAVAAVATDVAR